MSFSKTLLLPFFLFSIGTLNGCLEQSNVTPDSSSQKTAVDKTGNIDTAFHDGDIIFQRSSSGQSYAIQLATHSIYSHCGILFNDNGKWFVYEAVQPVIKTPVNKWIARGENRIYVVKRLKNADSLLTENALYKMRKSVNGNLGKDYDVYFGWSDERIYCSELVWKAYHDGTGLEVGELKKLGEYDLTQPAVKKIMKERYGNKIPLEEPMISPGNIYASELLITVRSNNL
ncbi:MAG: YiiX family permuted papain-like enzyme [Bacteroidia bacterium]